MIRYYKIRNSDGVILGVSSSLSLRKWQTKYSRIIAARNEDRASMIEVEAPENGELYRDSWMLQHPQADRLSTFADVIEITKEDYDKLFEEFTLDSSPITDEIEPEETSDNPEETFYEMNKLDIIEALADIEMRLAVLELGASQ